MQKVLDALDAAATLLGKQGRAPEKKKIDSAQDAAGQQPGHQLTAREQKAIRGAAAPELPLTDATDYTVYVPRGSAVDVVTGFPVRTGLRLNVKS